jgi:hypothetical protein
MSQCCLIVCTMNLQEHLENEGERKVAALINANALNEGALNEGALNEGALLAIIDEGNDAFKRVHGRKMTYAEMREMYG